MKENNKKHVKYPIFNFIGPPCKKMHCNGVLIITQRIKEKKFFYKCSECGYEI